MLTFSPMNRARLFPVVSPSATGIPSPPFAYLSFEVLEFRHLFFFLSNDGPWLHNLEVAGLLVEGGISLPPPLRHIFFSTL